MALHRMPSQTDVFSFIHNTHAVERISCPTGEISTTYNGTGPKNPHAHGHISAINHIFTHLAGKLDFPARDKVSLTSIRESETALQWLKDLHRLMFLPVTENATLALDTNNPKREDLGVWRWSPAMNTFSIAPPPGLIPAVMHLWLREVAEINDQVRDKTDMLYGISKEQAKAMYDAAYRASMIVSTVQPFSHGCNRLGRLVENAIRMHWNLPWKITHPGQEYATYTEDLVSFQQDQLPQLIAIARNAVTTS